MVALALALLVGYSCGSIPSAYLAGRLLGRGDIRDLGDGNPGAENVYRELGALPGIAVGACDILKGAAALLLVSALGLGGIALVAAGVAAVAGHNWPLLLQFHGGRGAATTLGVLLVTVPLAATPLAICAAACLLLKRSTTFSCAVAFAPTPLLAWLLGYSLAAVLFTATLPLVAGAVHCYTVILPGWQRARHTR